MSDRALREIYHEASNMRFRAYTDGHRSISLHEFTTYILAPLEQLVREQHARQLADIRENGT
jgi:hypothetical protein